MHVPSAVLPAGQYAPVLVQLATVLESLQNDPAGHVLSTVLPAGQYAPWLVHAFTRLGVAQ